MPRRFEILLVLGLIVEGCSTSAPPAATNGASGSVERLRNSIDAILSDSVFIPARASVKIVSLRTGEVLYDRDSRLLMRPASNMKLFTASTALHELGPSYQFKTSVFVDSLTADGTVRGNIYLKGYGDPDLSIEDLDSAAAHVRSMGITWVMGNVVGDNSFFDDLEWGNGWMWDDEPDPDEMFISALSVNKNCVSVSVAPTPGPSDSILASVDPPTPFVTIQRN
ncbi:MAG TPA: D-alanyl-D-alanine carboxypeptidase/D-alanyl-D-alanine-endopeptidase, partial [Bacteroidota bacterium]|nr:D-alanyl-D-alanine carboxypeptidase/D-alanyl-D-alanine-endopeptidase [Bacteroidota bacterium]